MSQDVPFRVPACMHHTPHSQTKNMHVTLHPTTQTARVERRNLHLRCAAFTYRDQPPKDSVSKLALPHYFLFGGGGAGGHCISGPYLHVLAVPLGVLCILLVVGPGTHTPHCCHVVSVLGAVGCEGAVGPGFSPSLSAGLLPEGPH